MIRLAEVDETLFFDVRGLDVELIQRRFLDSPLGEGTPTGRSGLEYWPFCMMG